MAIADATEKRIGIKNTWAFIQANPVKTQLRRPKVVRTEAGGVKKVDPDLLPLQFFRIVPMSGLVWDRSRTTPDEGRVSDVTEMLIGMPDADMQKDDYFPGENGGWFKLVHISPVTGYRKEARLRYTDTEPKA